MMNNNILITSAGQRVSLVRAFQNEIRKIDAEKKVYAVDLNPVLAPACHISDGFRKVKRVNDRNYIEDIIKICKQWDIGIIIPTIDTELKVLSENSDLFLKESIIPLVSEISFVEVCRDKRKMNIFFMEHDVDVPHIMDKNNLTFPCFIKPYDGSLSKDTFIINNESELTEYHFNNPKFIFMEYIDQAEYEEFTVDCYYDSEGYLKCIVPRKRIFVRAGEINKGVTKKNELISYINNRLSFIEGARGCLTMQFFMNPKTKHIVAIEINPRFGGGYPLSYNAGANFPRMIIEEYFLKQKIEYTEDWEDNLLMLRYDHEVFVNDYEL